MSCAGMCMQVAMAPAAVNALGTVVGMVTIDKCGRRCGSTLFAALLMQMMYIFSCTSGTLAPNWHYKVVGAPF